MGRDGSVSVDELTAGVLERAADATFVVDVTTGRAVHRWYDRTHSRLHLPVTPGETPLISAVHPDDLPSVLRAFGAVLNGAARQSTFARVLPDLVGVSGTLFIALQDLRELWPDGVLVQIWLVPTDSVVSPEAGATASLSSLAAAAPVGLQVRSAVNRVSFENDRFRELASGAREDIERVIDRAMGDAMEDATSVAVDVRAADRLLRLRVVPTRDAGGAILLAVVSLEDVTRAHDAEAQFHALFESSPVATALIEVDGTVARANESFAMVTGYPVADLVGMRFQEFTHPADVAADEELLAEVLAGARRNYQMDKRYIHRDGHEVWVELTVAPVRGADGSVQHLVAHVEDVTSRRGAVAHLDDDDAAEVLTYWATHDHLTALPNRRFLERRLQEDLRSGRRAEDRPVVLFLDLDDFKPINDVYGHVFGDEVLQTTARRLRNACRHDALVARYGGDEFVVVTRRFRNVAELPVLVDRIQAAVNAPIATVDGTTVRIGASIGIGVSREGDTPEAVVARADAAAYRAKAAGKNTFHIDLD